MADAELPQLEVLLAPIEDGASGVGADLRVSGDAYLALKDLRNEARLTEREALRSDDPDLSPLQAAQRPWSALVEGGLQALAETTKDLEIACWVCEGLVRSHGFAGLAFGLELLAALIEQYWDLGLYPVAEEDEGPEDRIAPLAGLLGRGGQGVLVQPVRMLPLSDRGDLPFAALWTVELANAPVPASEDAEARERLAARQAEQAGAINTAIRSSSPRFLRSVHAEATAALANLDRLMTAVDDKTGLGRFGSQLGAPLTAVVELLEQKVGHLFAAEAPAGTSDDALVGAGAGETGAPSAGGASSGGLASREQALETVLQVAAYFDRHEPQAMVAQSLRDVVRRARLPLVDLLAELIPDEAQRADFLQRAGIKSQSAESSYEGY